MVALHYICLIYIVISLSYFPNICGTHGVLPYLAALSYPCAFLIQWERGNTRSPLLSVFLTFFLCHKTHKTPFSSFLTFLLFSLFYSLIHFSYIFPNTILSILFLFHSSNFIAFFPVSTFYIFLTLQIQYRYKSIIDILLQSSPSLSPPTFPLHTTWSFHYSIKHHHSPFKISFKFIFFQTPHLIHRRHLYSLFMFFAFLSFFRSSFWFTWP